MKHLTSAERSEQARATWAGRKPKYERGRCIALRPDAYAALDARRGDRPWSVFLCELAGVTPPPDRRFNAPKHSGE